jgi:hypothetical protein
MPTSLALDPRHVLWSAPEPQRAGRPLMVAMHGWGYDESTCSPSPLCSPPRWSWRRCARLTPRRAATPGSRAGATRSGTRSPASPTTQPRRCLTGWTPCLRRRRPVCLPPGATERRWPPISATLISAGRDAVLVDPLMTAAQARGLGDWIAASGKNLTAVFVTHGHGDHWFGLSVILDRFPGCRAFAVPGVVEKMRRGSTPEYLAAFWNPGCPARSPTASCWPTRFPVTSSTSRVTGSSRWNSGIPTPTRQAACMSRRSAWSSSATPSTTTCTSTIEIVLTDRLLKEQ